MSGLFEATFRPRLDACAAVRIGHDNLRALAEATGGHTWASSLILPGEVVCPVGWWVLRVGPRRFAALSDEDFRARWVPVVGTASSPVPRPGGADDPVANLLIRY